MEIEFEYDIFRPRNISYQKGKRLHRMTNITKAIEVIVAHISRLDFFILPQNKNTAKKRRINENARHFSTSTQYVSTAADLR